MLVIKMTIYLIGTYTLVQINWNKAFFYRQLYSMYSQAFTMDV